MKDQVHGWCNATSVSVPRPSFDVGVMPNTFDRRLQCGVLDGLTEDIIYHDLEAGGAPPVDRGVLWDFTLPGQHRLQFARLHPIGVLHQLARLLREREGLVCTQVRIW